MTSMMAYGHSVKGAGSYVGNIKQTQKPYVISLKSKAQFFIVSQAG